jgi:threonine dehydrogenase-like Zn-dependent dehydrogenase
VATAEDGWDETLRTLSGGHGFDDVVVVAPGAEAFDRAVPHLANGGLLVGFAGTRKGEVARLPLGRVARHGVSLTASSGSTIADQRVVVDRIVAGNLVPERHVAAVTGLGDLHAAMQAVMDARFGGKILVLPAVDWPLMPLADLFAARPDLAALADDGRYWSLAVEDAVLGPREPPAAAGAA